MLSTTDVTLTLKTTGGKEAEEKRYFEVDFLVEGGRRTESSFHVFFPLTPTPCLTDQPFRNSGFSTRGRLQFLHPRYPAAVQHFVIINTRSLHRHSLWTRNSRTRFPLRPVSLYCAVNNCQSWEPKFTGSQHSPGMTEGPACGPKQLPVTATGPKDFTLDSVGQQV